MNNQPQPALDTQVGGSHYKVFKIQPAEGRKKPVQPLTQQLNVEAI